MTEPLNLPRAAIAPEFSERVDQFSATFGLPCRIGRPRAIPRSTCPDQTCIAETSARGVDSISHVQPNSDINFFRRGARRDGAMRETVK